MTTRRSIDLDNRPESRAHRREEKGPEPVVEPTEDPEDWIRRLPPGMPGPPYSEDREEA